jgi:hypothetical protein
MAGELAFKERALFPGAEKLRLAEPLDGAGFAVGTMLAGFADEQRPH